MSDRPRLLIVDDDRAITSTVGPMLRELADVDTAHTVAEALEKLASHTYAACVLDLVLGDDPAPLHDALSSREVPTLLISGRDPAALGPLAEVRGWSYAAKPLSPQVLRNLVAELLGVDAPEPTQRGTRPSPAPSQADASKVAPLPIMQVLDKLGDIVAMLVVAYLGIAGKVSGELAVGVVAAIAGVGTGLRTLGGRQVGAASAAVALAAFLTATPTSATASSSTRAGVPHVTPPAILGVLLLVLALGASGCSGPVITNPGAQVALRVAWPSVHRGAEGAGLCSDDPPEYLVGPTDAGPSPGAPADASTEASSDGDAGAP